MCQILFQQVWAWGVFSPVCEPNCYLRPWHYSVLLSWVQRLSHSSFFSEFAARWGRSGKSKQKWRWWAPPKKKWTMHSYGVNFDCAIALPSKVLECPLETWSLDQLCSDVQVLWEYWKYLLVMPFIVIKLNKTLPFLPDRRWFSLFNQKYECSLCCPGK